MLEEQKVWHRTQPRPGSESAQTSSVVLQLRTNWPCWTRLDLVTLIQQLCSACRAQSTHTPAIAGGGNLALWLRVSPWWLGDQGWKCLRLPLPLMPVITVLCCWGTCMKKVPMTNVIWVGETFAGNRHVVLTQAVCVAELCFGHGRQVPAFSQGPSV